MFKAVSGILVDWEVVKRALGWHGVGAPGFPQSKRKERKKKHMVPVSSLRWPADGWVPSD